MHDKREPYIPTFVQTEILPETQGGGKRKIVKAPAISPLSLIVFMEKDTGTPTESGKYY